MKGPESRLIDKIDRQVKKYRDSKGKIKIFTMKMNMAPGSVSGIPDKYYESIFANLWVEYKYVGETWTGKQKIPVSKITSNQIEWLSRAVNNKQKCAVVFGASDGGCVILQGENIFNPPVLEDTAIYSPKQIAAIIALSTIGSESHKY